jgi:hypothetical protein
MSTVTIDYFIETASVAAAHKLYGGWFMEAGQSISAYPVNLTSVKFYLKKVSSPTGLAHATLYDVSGKSGTNAAPTGTILATSADTDISEISATDYSLEEFTFTSKPALGYKRYSVGLRLAGNGTVDATSYILMAKNKVPAPANKCHNGNAYIFDTAHSFVYQTAGNDIVFYAYGDNSAVPTTTVRGATVRTSDRRTTNDIIQNSQRQIALSTQLMKNAMLERERIAKRDMIANQKKIKKLKK